MAMSAVTVAVAGHLVRDSASLGGRFIAFDLCRLSITLIGELFFRQDGRKFFGSGRRRWVKSREFLWTVHLCLKGRGQEDGANSKYMFHSDGYFIASKSQVV